MKQEHRAFCTQSRGMGLFLKESGSQSRVLTEAIHLDFCCRKINLGQLEDAVGEERPGGKETR